MNRFHRFTFTTLVLAVCLTCFPSAISNALRAETPATKTSETPESTPPDEGSDKPEEPANPESTEPPPPNANPSSIIGEQADLPRLDEIPLPQSGELLQATPFDWVVLITERVVQVDPIAPRPDTLKILEEEFQKLNKLPMPKREIDPIGYEELLQRKREARYLTIFLQEGEDLEFSIDRRFIKEIIHFEDVILRRVDKLLDELKPGEAYELLEVVYDRDPLWPGVDQREKRLLLTEALLREQQGELEDSLGFLERLHTRDAAFPQLEDAVIRVTGSLHQQSLAEKSYRRARFFLKRLKLLYPSNPANAERTQPMIDLAKTELDAALQLEQRKEFAEAVAHAETAARIWPSLAELRGQYERMHNRFQRIRIGILAQAQTAPSDRLFSTAADQRVRLLTQVPFFNVERIEGATLRYRSRVIDEWEPTALGRSIIFHPQLRRRSWESIAPFSSSRLVEQILFRIRPDSPVYDERLDNLIDVVEFRSPQEFEIRFSEVPLNPPALLTFDCIPAEDDDLSAPLLPQHGARFTLVANENKEQLFERLRPEPLESPERHVARVTEVLYDRPDVAVQALIRGEVDMLDQVQPWDAPALAKQANVFILPYAVPGTHVIQFHPRSKLTRNRALRRAMTLALDRSTLLQTLMLRSSGAGVGQLTTAPYRTTHPGYNQALAVHSKDPRLAISLGVAAKKEMGGELPHLKFAIADPPNPPEVVQRLIESWEQIGVSVQLVSPDTLSQSSLTEESPPWDLVYRIVHLADPQVDLWPFLTLQDRPTVSALAGVPAWLRQKLLLLDQAGDFETSNSRLRELQQLLWAEAELIPLWEIREHMAVRKHMRGIPDQPVYFYQNVEQWRSLPWYPAEVD